MSDYNLHFESTKYKRIYYQYLYICYGKKLVF